MTHKFMKSSTFKTGREAKGDFTQAHKREGDMKMEQRGLKTGLRWPHDKEHQQPPGDGRGKDSSLEHPEGA